MFDLTTLSNSLQVNSTKLSMLVEHLLKPNEKNHIWSRLSYNIYGLTDFRSRLGNFDIPWRPKNIFSVPELEHPFDKKLSDIFDQRAIEIFNRSKLQNKKIVIMWSGGIDSTSVVCAFIKNLSRSDLGSIIVCTTTSGIAENPYFYETQIRGKFEMLHLRDLDFSDQFLDQHILLDGDPGDCIFGPSTAKYKSLWADNQHLRPWKDSLPILYQLYHDPLDLKFSGWLVDQINQNLVDQQQQGLYTNIKTISDWFWWQYYNLKWQGSMTRNVSYYKKNKKSKISKTNLQEFFDLCFFAGTDFQIWSYQNLSTLCTNEMIDHKSQVKHYIFELDKNKEYYLNKKKENSGVLNWTVPLVVDQDGVHYYPEDPGVVETFQKILVL